MRVALVGYGKMGKTIEKILKEKGITDIITVDPFAKDAHFNELKNEYLKGVDVVIDFAASEGVKERVLIYVENKVNVVMGTTGWYDKIDEIKKIVENKIGFIWSGNYSIGVNLFFKIIRCSAKLFDKFPIYDTMLYEIHHNQKKDSPSGTAKMIEKILLDEISTKKSVVEETLNRKIEKTEIHSASVRGGYVPGIHVVMFDSEDDTIELKHSARSRDGFARGAVVAADWINGKKGFFCIDDLMNDFI